MASSRGSRGVFAPGKTFAAIAIRLQNATQPASRRQFRPPADPTDHSPTEVLSHDERPKQSPKTQQSSHPNQKEGPDLCRWPTPAADVCRLQRPRAAREDDQPPRPDRRSPQIWLHRRQPTRRHRRRQTSPIHGPAPLRRRVVAQNRIKISRHALASGSRDTPSPNQTERRPMAGDHRVSPLRRPETPA